MPNTHGAPRRRARTILPLPCLAALLLACARGDPESQAIGRLALASEDGLLRLSDAVPAGWDHVHIFAPYAMRSDVCRTLGVAARECERVVPFASMDDGRFSLAFVADGRLLRYVDHPRHNGDFGRAASGKPVPRAQAVYRIVPGEPGYSGRRSLMYVPLDQPPS